MISAFGVDHGGEVSKAFPKMPKVGGLMRMGSPAKMQNAAMKGFSRGKKQGMGTFRAGLRGMGSAIKSSPGTAAIGAGTAGMAGYGGYKAFDN